MSGNPLTPSEFVAITNQVLENAWPGVMIEGEVASFKVNQGKWVFFDLKDAETSVSCFMPLWDLRMPIEDGMKVVVRATAKVTQWGRFSLTVKAVKPVGEGNLKKSFEMLKKKLAAEGLFNPARKRRLPEDLRHIGVISSTQAAGYGDFVKILNVRWGGMRVSVAHTQVQGLEAPDQIMRALRYFNERSEVQAIVILRGGGSADDLSCFNDEALTRAIAASKIPVVTGIGHERDESLADLAADLRASTPSNAAELLTRDRAAEMRRVHEVVRRAGQQILSEIEHMRRANGEKIQRVARGVLTKYIEPMLGHVREGLMRAQQKITVEYEKCEQSLRQKMKTLEALNPEKVLRQGYAILSGKISPGETLEITTFAAEIEAEVKKVKKVNRGEP